MGQFKGTGIVAIRKYLSHQPNHNDELIKNQLTENELSIYNGSFTTSWIALDVASTIFSKIAKSNFSEVESGMKLLGNVMADDNLKGIYKPLVRLASVSFIMKRSNFLWKRYHNQGLAYCDYIDNQSAYFEVKDYPEMPLNFKHLMTGYIEKVMEITGVKNVSVDLVKGKNNPVRWNIYWD